MKECKYCGTFYEDSLNHCPNCGGNRVVSEEEKRLKEILAEKENTNQQKFFSNSTVETNNNKRTPIIVVSAIVILALIVGIYFYKSTGFSNVSKQEIESYVEKGTAYYNSGNYELALKEFSSIPKATTSYSKVKDLIDDAKEKYRKEVLIKVDSLENESNYKDAYSLLESAEGLLLEDNAIEEKKNNIYSKYRNNEIEKTILTVNELETKNDYFGAIKVVQETQNFINDSDELEQKYKQLESNLINNLDDNIITIYKNDGYDGIVTYLQEINSLIPNNEKILNELDVWKNRRTIYINELEPFTQEDGIQFFTVDNCTTDTLGNTYSNSLGLFSSGLTSDIKRKASIEYRIVKEYGKLMFTVFVTQEAREEYKYRSSKSSNWNKATINIYGDGELLYSKRGNYDLKTEPEYVEIDISGTEYLTIELVDAGYLYYTGLEFYDALIALGDIKIGW